MHHGKSGAAERGGARDEGSGVACRGQIVRAALLGLLLAVPAAAGAGEDPEPRLRPPAQAQPQAGVRKEPGDADEARRALERDRREGWQEWQRERGLTWREWLRVRRDAEGALREQRREDALEHRQPRREPPGRTLGERLDEQWRRQRRLHDDRPGSPGRLENPALERRLGPPGRDALQPLRP